MLLQQGYFAEIVLSIEFLPNGSFFEPKKIKVFPVNNKRDKSTLGQLLLDLKVLVFPPFLF